MKKGKTNLLIPVFVILGLIVVLGYVLLREDILDVFKTYTLKRIDGYPKVVNSNKLTEKQRVLITSKEEYDAKIAEIFENTSELPLPEIDFEKNNLLIVTTETNDTLGYRIKVDKVVKNEQDQELDIFIVHSKPGETCVNEEKKNVAIDMVSIEKLAWKVKFNKVDTVKECN